MPRRRSTELKINHERWLISYADFITLLFAFFVVMYSISQINESKYRVLSSTLEEAFKPIPKRASSGKTGASAQFREDNVLPAGVTSAEDASAVDQGNLPKLEDQFRQEFKSLLDSQLMGISSNEMWLQIELRDSILFPSGSAEVSAQARNIFARVAKIVQQTDNPVQIEGFTDNVPIQTSEYPSNWELSSARASAIVKRMVLEGVEPNRLAAVGYGEFQPVASNQTEEGRAQNRRVAIMIARNQRDRPTSKWREPVSKASEQKQNVEETYPAADRDIEAVEMGNGNLLFSSDPELPRSGSAQ
ncbi:flagellar motor protein MotD [Gilvimarinus chinensis]|uniref:flagellar motor protein MotD n=1 Tax=Gilvimarinus chinensis TaxID=396005 RepID=UPI00036931C7|nr:flagellar motor protein MotD [Gilvimarinus chinensis]